MASITCHQVTKIYQGEPAVRSISVDMPDGEFVVLVGPSGCGKSTLLRMIAGLEEITEGEIRIGDRVVNDLEPKDRNIAMVFQNYALYPHMSVYDNMAYGLKNRRMAKDEIRKRINRAVEILHLEPEMLKRKPRQLSGGQRQRVAIGRAIVREPQAFLFDEPLSNLDAKLRTQMRVEIKRLHELLGVTTVYVTHDQVEAMTLAERLVVMHDSRAEQVGSAQEIYRKPATTFVATFIGSPAMNLLNARYDADLQTLCVGDDCRLPLPDDVALAPGPVTVGIRPEHLAVADTDAVQIPLPVELVENLGADVLVHGHFDDAPFVMRVAGDTAVKVGDTLPLRVSGAVHLFDVHSGKRIGD